jgi:hypothetical protein
MTATAAAPVATAATAPTASSWGHGKRLACKGKNQARHGQSARQSPKSSHFRTFAQ